MDIQADYIVPIERVQQSLHAGEARVHLPLPLGLLSNRPLMHFHQHAELFIQLEGKRRFNCPFETFTLAQGDLCLIPPQLPHAEIGFHQSAKEPFCGIVLWAEADAISIHRSIVRTSGAAPIIGHALSLRSTEESMPAYLIGACCQVSTAELRTPLIQALLGMVVSALRSYSENPPPVLADPSAQLVSKASGIVQAYLPDSGLSVATVAEQTGCTPDHLSRCFQKQLGLSAQSYILGERMRLAKRLLRRSNMRICEVAWACGFSSANYFIRSFGGHVGTTPKQYRQQAASTGTATAAVSASAVGAVGIAGAAAGATSIPAGSAITAQSTATD